MAWERSRASRVVAHGHIAMNHSLTASIAASQTYSRELEARLMAVRSQRTEDHRLTSCLVSWSRSRIASSNVKARRHDGAGSDDFFEPELFREASPRAGSRSPLMGTKPIFLHSCFETTSCVSSESVGRGFRQRCSDDEVSTHTCQIQRVSTLT